MSIQAQVAIYDELIQIRKLLQELVERRKRDRERKQCPKFTPPTAIDVAKYSVEKGFDIDPEEFVSFYESKGWLVGKTKMRNWHAAVNRWARRSQLENPQPAEPVINKERQELIDKGNEEMKRAFEASMGGGR